MPGTSRYAGRSNRRPTTETDVPGRHVAWHRPHREAAWVEVARGGSFREALLAMAEVLGEACDDDAAERLVLAEGRTPAEALAAAIRQPPKNRWRRVEDLGLER
jgi:hypothetical protein